MKIEMDLQKIKEFLEYLFSGGLKLGLGLFYISLQVIMVFGAFASMILLSKMFPEIAHTFITNLLTALEIIFKIYGFMFAILFICAMAYLFLILSLRIEKLDKNRKEKMEKSRKKFMKELKIELKKSGPSKHKRGKK